MAITSVNCTVLPCPFCEERNTLQVVGVGTNMFVGCPRCHIPLTPIAIWNSRPIEAAYYEEIAKERASLSKSSLMIDELNKELIKARAYENNQLDAQVLTRLDNHSERLDDLAVRYHRLAEIVTQLNKER